MIISIATAFGAGFLASLSPCVYPMLPITIGYLTKQSTSENQSQMRKRLQVVGFFVGQVLMFTALGLIAVQLGEIFGFSSQSKIVNIAVGIILLVMATVSISTKAQETFAKFNSFLPKGTSKGTPSFFSALVFGATSAVVASPCTSPVLGGVLSQVSSQGEFLAGVLQMFAFAFGMGLIFLVLGLGLLNIKKIPRSGKWMGYIHKLTSGILFVGSGYYFWMAFA